VILTGIQKIHFHIDHIIPESANGPDHPRNYALMPATFNSAFSSWWMPAKSQYIGNSLFFLLYWSIRLAVVGNTAARTAILFAKYIHKKTKLQVTLDDMEMF